MPATCFSRLPRSAGAIAAALACELAAALRGVVRYGARPSGWQRLVCTGRLKCSAGARARLLASAFCTAAPRSS